MNDLGFDLHYNQNRIKNKIKIRIIIILSILSVFIFILLFYKITKILNKNNIIDKVPLIKNKVINIKEYNDKIEINYNDTANIYNILDNKKELNKNITINNSKEKINMDEIVILKDTEKNIEQDLLNDKINEIIKEDIPVKKIENIKINNQEKKIRTNINDLEKLGNKSLIKNIKSQKDQKPGIKVQILASKNKDNIQKYWHTINNKYNSLFKDKIYYIDSFKTNQGEIYKLQIGNFLDNNSALNFCKEYIQITNKSKIDCILVKNNN